MFHLLLLSHNENNTNAAFSEKCPLDIDKSQSESPHVKAFLLLQSHFFGISLPITDYVTDLKSVLDQSLRIVQAMGDIASLLRRFTTTINICIMLQCLMQVCPNIQCTIMLLETSLRLSTLVVKLPFSIYDYLF